MKITMASFFLFVAVTAFAQRTIEVKPNLEVEARAVGTKVTYYLTWTNAPCSYGFTSIGCSGSHEVNLYHFAQLCEYIPQADRQNACRCVDRNGDPLSVECGVQVSGQERIFYGRPWSRTENEEWALQQYELLRQARDRYWDALTAARRQVENFNQRAGSTDDDP